MPDQLTQKKQRPPEGLLMMVSRVCTLWSDILWLAQFLFACLLDSAYGYSPGAGPWAGYAVWKVLPFVILINLMYATSRGITWLQRPRA
jgi:hypothetical protein